MMIKNGLFYIFNRLGYKVTKINKNSNKDFRRNAILKEAERFRWLLPYNFNSIIDIGANEGQFTEKILTLFPNTDVHCFEPISSVFNLLKKNLSYIPKVKFYNYGLGDIEKVVNIFVNEYSPSSSLLPMSDLHKTNFEYAVQTIPDKIEVRTLDSFFPLSIPKPLLIKIDVQGYEMFVLMGGKNVLSQADVIIIETSFYPLYEGQPLFHDIYQHLLNLGFAYFGNVEQLISSKDNSILQADAVFLKSSSPKT
ncbi:FkbM family methyltransferase [Aquiflexum sp. TKW24L]|uniref:FkbM family methyltransferase n=1 Tax=Aquiflexum sp. TKW24L TaxID=2942212 RepID=UPI0020BF1C49|nr:FkbM family methyltransferase [Aquiflexum sp. TKW24L]MCL6261239.1 FkbM family methyltransferase [Aquiflexum sp. TKW24L]